MLTNDNRTVFTQETKPVSGLVSFGTLCSEGIRMRRNFVSQINISCLSCSSVSAVLLMVVMQPQL